MKKLIIISTLFVLSISGKTQPQIEFGTYLKTTDTELVPDYGIRYKPNAKAKAWQLTGIALVATVTEAIGDGLYDKGKQQGNRKQMMTGKALQAFSVGTRFLYIPIMRNSEVHWIWAAISELGVRALTFDVAYNLTRKLPATHIGNTTYWDKALRWTKQPGEALFWGRTIVCIFTVSLTFNQFNN